jgi:hypothetical protein
MLNGYLPGIGDSRQIEFAVPLQQLTGVSGESIDGRPFKSEVELTGALND